MNAVLETQKRIAAEHPCYLDMETQAKRFIWDHKGFRHTLTVDAGYHTINRGFTGPVWHLSVSWLADEQFVADDLVRYALWLMQGTGEEGKGKDAQRVEALQMKFTTVVHVRRAMTPEERGSIALRDVRDTHEATTRAAAARKVAVRNDWDEDLER